MKNLPASLLFAVLAFNPPCSIAQATTKDSLKTDLTAENMLLWQRYNGGWPKDTYTSLTEITTKDVEPNSTKKVIDYTKEQTEEQKKIAEATKNYEDATIDNGHTVMEIRYMLKAYKNTSNETYLTSADRGLRYLFVAQYPNGGWPQFYPDKRFYKHQITFNDNAMVNVLNLLYDITEGSNDTEPFKKQYATKAEDSFNRGVNIILKTQIKVHGKKTVWCAQYDEVTLQPDKARSYELVSLSGMESVGIVRVLMRIPKPTKEMQQAVADAITWFEQSKIVGLKTERISDPSQPNGVDVVLKPDASSVIWGRFYDIDTNKPFFCDRDGIKKNTLAEIGNERRTHYGWYGTWPADLIGKEYEEWKRRIR